MSSVTNIIGVFFGSPVVTQNELLEAHKVLESERVKVSFDKAKSNAEFLKSPISLILLC